MRPGHILFSAIHFFVILLILSLGGLFLALPYAETFRFNLTHYIYERPELFKLMGFVILSCGFLLVIGFYLFNKRHFLTIEMKPVVTLVDEAIVRGYVQDYWKKMDPSDDAAVDVVIRKGKVLEIIVSTPKNWEGEIEENLLWLQKDLGDYLSVHLGYDREFYLTLSDN